MTGSKATHVTGSVQNDHDLRRRHVSEKQENGSVIAPEDEADDKKPLKVKKPAPQITCTVLTLPSLEHKQVSSRPSTTTNSSLLR